MCLLESLSTPEAIRQIEDEILAVADRRGVDALRRSRMLLVLEELLTNIRLYAYPDGPGRIAVEVLPRHGDDDRIMHLYLDDWGPPFNPLEKDEMPDLTGNIEDRPIGGLGLFLVRNMVCGISYNRTIEDAPLGGRNRLSLSFPL
ncbi:ATP-binding protein [Desulfovibrio sp. OttesenSCG-928-F20]|nr:ATP-binding protein [Desulfovibrio sp. OttesenSCG-928-F20]